MAVSAYRAALCEDEPQRLARGGGADPFPPADALLRDGTHLPVSRTLYALFQSALSRRAWRPQRRRPASSVFFAF